MTMLYNYTKTSFKAIMIIFFGFYNLEFVRPSMTSKYVLNKFIPLMKKTMSNNLFLGESDVQWHLAMS